MRHALKLSFAAFAWALASAPVLAQPLPQPETQTPSTSTEEGRRLIDRAIARRAGETRVQALDRQERERAAAQEAQRQNEASTRAQIEQQGRDIRARLDQAVASGAMTPEARAQFEAAARQMGENIVARIDRMNITMTAEQRQRVNEIIDNYQGRLTSGQLILTQGDAGLVVDTVDMMLEIQQTLNRDLEPALVDIVNTIQSGVRNISDVRGVEAVVPDIQQMTLELSRIPGRIETSFGTTNYAIGRARAQIAENRDVYEQRAQTYLDELHGRTLRETLEELDRTNPVGPAPNTTPQPTSSAPDAAPTPASEPVQTGRSRRSREGLNPDGTPIGDPYGGLRVPAQQTQPQPAPAPRRTPTPQRPPPTPPRQQLPPPVVLTQTQPRSNDGERVGGDITPGAHTSPMPTTWTVGDTTYSLRVYFENGRLNYSYTETTRRLPARSTLVSGPAMEGAMNGDWSVIDALAQAGNALGRLPDLRVNDTRDFYPGLGEPNGLSVTDLEAIYEGWDPYANGFHYPGPSSVATTPSSAPRSMRIDWYLPPSGDLSAQIAADRAAGYLARSAAEMGMPIDWSGFNASADPYRVDDPSRRSPLGDLWATRTSSGEDAWGGRLYGDRNPWGYEPIAETSRDLARALYGPLWSDRPFQLAYDPSGLDNLFSQEGETVGWLNGMSQRDYLRALVSGDTNALSRLLAQPFNVLLTWGSGAYDLDLHMTGPSGTDSTQRFHIYYAAPGQLDAFPFAALIRDCVCSNGSEVILTSNLVQGGVYRISVFNYGNQSASTNLADASDAVIQIVRGGTAVSQGSGTTIVGGHVIYTGTPPTGEAGNTWVAVEIDPRTGRIRAPHVITQNPGSPSVP